MGVDGVADRPTGEQSRAVIWNRRSTFVPLLASVAVKTASKVPALVKSEPNKAILFFSTETYEGGLFNVYPTAKLQDSV